MVVFSNRLPKVAAKPGSDGLGTWLRRYSWAFTSAVVCGGCPVTAIWTPVLPASLPPCSNRAAALVPLKINQPSLAPWGWTKLCQLRQKDHAETMPSGILRTEKKLARHNVPGAGVDSFISARGILYSASQPPRNIRALYAVLGFHRHFTDRSPTSRSTRLNSSHIP